MKHFYKFPIIENISDVLPAIKDAPEFAVSEKEGGYTVVNYHMATKDTFPPIVDGVDDHYARVRRECRGIIFETSTGRLISRPYHKFFNVNERAETLSEELNILWPHVILEKLDGSMIRPFYVNGQIRWGTKMGLTDVAMPAEAFAVARTNYVRFAEVYLSIDCTPLFEWCSRSQKIVLDYPQDRLVLTGMRVNRSGNYYTQPVLEQVGNEWGIDLVQPIYQKIKIEDMKHFQDHVAAMENTEGYVLRWTDGHMVKIKCDWYLALHKAKAALMQEKGLIELILDEKLDDLKAVLEPVDREAVDEYADAFNIGVQKTVHSVEDDFFDYWDDQKQNWISNGINAVLCENLEEVERLKKKNFALWVNEKIDPSLRSIMFKMYSGMDAKESILDAIRKNLGTQKNVDKVRGLFGCVTWKGLANGN